MKIIKKLLKYIGISLGGLVGLLLVSVLSLNIMKFAIYFDYYKIETRIMANPGLNSGAIPQGIATDENHDFILTTAYMDNKSNSRIYMCENSKNSYVNLIRNGKKFTNHVGGIGLDKDTIYISNYHKIYTVSVADFLSSIENKADLEIGSGIEINNKSSFCSVEGNYLYVGEYSDGLDDTTDTKINHNGKTYRAVISKYHTSDLSHPVEMYAITNWAQGVSVSPNGDIYISTSHGLNDSHFYKFSKDSIVNPIDYTDNLGYTTALYFLDEPIKDIRGPAMAQDLSYHNGKVITLSESASNKYIFGKYFFAFDIVGLKF